MGKREGLRVLKGSCISSGPDETIAIGEKIASNLRRGDVVALIGDLGAGKTVLTKGIAKGIGVKDVRYVNSPTFTIIKEYKGRMPLYHFDLYRLDRSNPMDILSYEEYFYADGVTVIEWANKIERLLPGRHVEIRLVVIGDDKRKISIKEYK